MQLSAHAQAVLLLTAHFGASDRTGVRPLATGEWNRLARWLKEHKLEPASLLEPNPEERLSGWMDREAPKERIIALLRRGVAMGLALDRWQSAGVWVMTRSDPDYPACLKERLKQQAPPLFFGLGNRTLLKAGGLAVVGSRKAECDELKFAENIGAEAASQGYAVVSGGARGIDEAAMLGSLDAEGTAIGVLAADLLKTGTSKMYRQHLAKENLVLVSPYNPEARFNAGNAMARNKLIYCLSNAAVVACSTNNSGGTWAGAVENLRAGWVPLWVRRIEDTKSGNHALVKRGAAWLGSEKSDLKTLFQWPESAREEELSLFSQGEREDRHAHGSFSNEGLYHTAIVNGSKSRGDAPDPECEKSAQKLASHVPLDEVSFYQLFLCKLARILREEDIKSRDLPSYFDLTKKQLDQWLKKAVSENKVKRLRNPVRYRWQGDDCNPGLPFNRSD